MGGHQVAISLALTSLGALLGSTLKAAVPWGCWALAPLCLFTERDQCPLEHWHTAYLPGIAQ